MAIGGLKEKTMAAMRNGIDTVLIPADNEPDLDDIDPVVRNALNFICVDSVEKALPVALVHVADETANAAALPKLTEKKDRQVTHGYA